MVRIGTFVVLGMSLTACQMTQPNTLPTATQAAPAVTAPAPAPITAAGVAHARTKAGPKGGTALLTILDQTLAQDPSLIAARLTEANSRLSLQRTSDWRRPEVSATAQRMKGHNPSVVVQFSHPILDFGKRNARIAQAAQQVENNALSISAAHQSLAYEIILTALTATQAQQESALNARRISAFRNALEQADQLTELDMLSSVDRQLAKVRLEQAQKDKRASDIKLTQAKASWVRLTGKTGMPPTISITGDLLRRFGLSSLNAAKSRAHTANIQLRLAQQEKALLIKSIEVQRTTGFPTLSALGTTQLGPTSGRRTNIGLNLEFPVFNRNNHDALADRQSQLAVKDAEISELKRQAGFQIDSLWQNITGSKEIANLERQSVTSLRQRAEDLEQQLETGLIPFTQVVTAKTEQFNTETAALNSRFSAERAALDLLILTGAIVTPK